ncbi:hypothetical protein EDC94DRAFT_628861 [Helicostylum pulchrum]|nr:hypothetical protein EDC94DRAFT_628861 [Helicostylum pulchrum]
MLQSISIEREAFYNHAVNQPSAGIFVVYGSAGTGKSYLLRLHNAFLPEGVIPITLAPTGIAAYTINCETIHRFRY